MSTKNRLFHRASRMRLAMGTFVTVNAEATSEPTAENAIGAALNRALFLESELHPQRAGSEIATINAAPLGVRVQVGETTLRVLRIAAEVFTASAGRFDPCLPTREGDFATIELASDHVVVHERVNIDLGGIAKGFAVDEALIVLKKHGCEAGSVNIGGEVAAFGAPESIALRRSDGSLITFDLDNEAVAITDMNSVAGPSEHRGYYQRRAQRLPVRDYAAIAAPSGAIADALTKCALFSTDDELLPLLAQFNARLL